MRIKVLSLDISASCTGWAFIDSKFSKNIKYGTIKTSPTLSRARRLKYFREELLKLLLKLKPTNIVIEDVYSGVNKKVIILLSKFAGVAEECCVSTVKVEPYIIHTNTVKAYFKSKNKEDVFNIILDILDWDSNKIKFKKYNDITDAIAQLLCYYDKILNNIIFRIDKDYGYLYEI